LKTTLLVDTATNAVLDIHVTTTRRHDTQVAPQVVKRNAASIAVSTGDRGYEDQKLRRLPPDNDIHSVIKHREFTPLHEAWNARLDTDLYHQRNMNETVKVTIKQKFGAFVWSRLWWKQFRELVAKCVVHNMERSLTLSREERDCPQVREELAAAIQSVSLSVSRNVHTALSQPASNGSLYHASSPPHYGPSPRSWSRLYERSPVP
jgi:hypothetical protein